MTTFDLDNAGQREAFLNLMATCELANIAPYASFCEQEAVSPCKMRFVGLEDGELNCRLENGAYTTIPLKCLRYITVDTNPRYDEEFLADWEDMVHIKRSTWPKRPRNEAYEGF